MDKTSSPLRVVFAGTPEFAAPTLAALLDAGAVIPAVLTQPDRPAGRGKKLRASPVKCLALEHELEVWQPNSLRDAGLQDRIVELGADLMVVVAFGLMIPDRLLDAPRLGCWNVHASLLPRWRGAAPIHRAVEAGDQETGVCVMKVVQALDAGPVFHRVKTPIMPDDNTGTLHDRLAQMGARALVYCTELARKGELPAPVEQDHAAATYAHKLSKAEAELDWGQPAEVLARRVRAFSPWPVAWCELGGQRLRVWRAEAVEDDLPPGQIVSDQRTLVVGTAKGSLKMLEVQKAGGQRMSVGQFLTAHSLTDD
ncbi:MAG: methionyl-tRNA formyltransferase [Lysobacterales bacterium]